MADSKPAVILITADELCKAALSCYGAKAVDTPNLDRLALSGTLFSRAYANSPWCLPSRSTIITGLLPHNHGAYSNFRKEVISPDRPNLYNVLRTAGYHVAHVGKCHYTPVPYNETKPDITLPYDQFRQYYLDLGIDDLWLQDDKQVSVWFLDDYAKELEKAGFLAAYRAAVWNREYKKVFAFPGPSEWHPDSWVGRKAVEAIRSYRGEGPFFGFISFSGPHFPFDPPADYFARVHNEHVGSATLHEGEFDLPDRIHHESFHGPGGIEGAGSAGGACRRHSDKYWRALRRNYFANVALIDDQVGAVLSAVEERFGDDALVIFTADHGEMLGNHGLWGKNNCGYEDVLNVPLLVRYPGQERPSSTDALVTLADLTPTVLNLVGVKNPPTDGEDLRDLVQRGGHRYVISEGEGFVVVSDGTYKYVRARNKRRDYTEFFDLQADPGEVQNVIDHPSYAGKVAELQQAALDAFMSTLLP